MPLQIKVMIFFAILLFIITGHWFFFNRYESGILKEEMTRKGNVLARMFAQLNAEPLLSVQIERLEKQVDAIHSGDQDVLYSRVYNSERVVIAATDRADEGWTHSGEIPGRTEIAFYQNMMTVSAPIGEDVHPWGMIEIAFSLQAMQTNLNRGKTVFFIILMIELCVAAGFALFLELQVVRPLISLAHQLIRITPDNLQSPLAGIKYTASEIDRVRVAIDDLRYKLEQARTEIITRTRWATLGQIATDMSHEIRNPLAAISSAIEFLSEKSRFNKEERKSIHIIQEEITRLDDFLGEFLEFTQIKPVNITQTRVNPLIEDCLLLLKPLFRKKALNVEFEPGKGLPAFNVDCNQVKRVLVNLLMNSINAVSRHGKIRIVSRAGSCYIIIQVQDDGTGIRKEDMGRVFDPYFTTRKTGSGIGLSISKKIVEQHGGSMTIHSDYGEGTIVLVKLPFNRGEDLNGKNTGNR